MRNLITLLVVILVIACSSVKSDNYETDNPGYLITKIDSINNYYIIYATLNGVNHKIVSEKDSSLCKNKIVLDNKYPLNTESIFTVKIKDRDTIRTINNNINIDCITLHNVAICKEYDLGIYDVLKSSNLRGLCIIR